jgi:hypothetical protein
MTPYSLYGLRRVVLATVALSTVTYFVPPTHAQRQAESKKRLRLDQGFSQTSLDVRPSLTTYRSRSLDAASPALAATPRLAALQGFFEDNSPDWEVHWDSRSDRPHLIQGAGHPLLPGAANSLTAADISLETHRKVKLADVEGQVRGFMARYPDLLRVDPESLRLDPTRSYSVGNGRAWFVELQQFYRGVPVEGANVYFRINNGNLVQFGADRIGDVQVNMVPRSDRARRFSELLAQLGIPRATLSEIRDEGTLKIYPTLTADEKPGEAFRGTPGTGYGYTLVWEFVFRRQNDPTTYKALLDAHSGKILQVVDLNRYSQVKGGIYPTTNTDAEVVVPFPFANVTNGTAKVTDADGNYTYGSGTATSTLNGKYFKMTDTCGSISLSNSTDGNLNFGTSSGTDCTTPGVGGAGNTHASRTGFFHLTNINRKAVGFLPSNSWLNSTVTANMNVNDVCNAYWDGSALNFFRSGTYNGLFCSNTGEIAAVFLHEWGHGLDDNTGGSASEYGSGEAVGDTFAFLETKDACIGPNFTPGVKCDNCSTCTGVRDVGDFALGGTATIAKPSTVADNAGINCDQWSCPYTTPDGYAYRGPMGYEGHCESYIASTANWDLAQSLIATYGTDEGWAAMDSIWYESLTASKSAYQVVSGGTCNPSATVNGCGSTNWYTVYLAVDDDDGNLANGTPNGCRIWDAFNAHGIACGTRPACAGGCTPQAIANAGPDQTIAPGGSVTIGTAAVSGTTYSWSPGGQTTAQITVSPTATTTYTVTATTTCGSASDSVVVSVESGSTAVYDSTLKAPKCAIVGSSCDSGASLLLGRSSKGPEPNYPNTINSSCSDGTSGTFHSDESNDRLKVATSDGSNLAPGKTVTVTATVWAYSSYSSDHLDLYYAANATSPSWTLIGTYTPPAAGAQTLTASYTLPSGGSLQAVRANFRYSGSASSCSTGAYDDHDDLVFAVTSTPDTTAPATAITAPANGATVSGTTTVSASASDNVGVTQVEFYVDSVLKSTDTTSPYSYAWDTTTYAAGSHSVYTKAYDAANNVGTSATITVTVNNSVSAQMAAYDSTLKAPKCAVVGLSCDSGASLLLGRATKGPEPNYPNTINSTCADGTSGTYHSDESNDRLKVATNDGGAFAAGKTVTITATVWAYSSYTSDHLDLYYAANASSPSWTLIGSYTPSGSGARTITATYTLPTGTLQAVRANFRYGGAASSCTTGSYNDHDDLVFAVQ